jgi:hypothetical protein
VEDAAPVARRITTKKRYQGCGSGLDPDFKTCVDPDSESGSMGKKNEEKNALFLNFLNIFIAKRDEIVPTTSIFDFYIDF